MIPSFEYCVNTFAVMMDFVYNIYKIYFFENRRFLNETFYDKQSFGAVS